MSFKRSYNSYNTFIKICFSFHFNTIIIIFNIISYFNICWGLKDWLVVLSKTRTDRHTPQDVGLYYTKFTELWKSLSKMSESTGSTENTIVFTTFQASISNKNYNWFLKFISIQIIHYSILRKLCFVLNKNF